MYYWILSDASVYDFILSIILTISFVILAKILFDTLSNNSGTLDILFFFILFKFIYTVSLENVIGQGFIPYIYFTGILFIFGGFKLIKSKECYDS